MRRTIGVYVGDTPVRSSTLRYNLQGNRENAAFEYEGDWLVASDAFSIDPTPPPHRRIAISIRFI